MAFTPIETQEQLDETIRDRVARAKDSARKEFEGWVKPEDVQKQMSDLQEQLSGTADTVKTLTEEKTALEKQVKEATEKIAKYETDSVKTKVATEYGLPIDAISFLQGDDETAIKESAESLKSLVGTKQAPPMAGTEPPSGNSDEEAMKQMLRDMRGE